MNLPDTWPLMLAIALTVAVLGCVAFGVEYVKQRHWRGLLRASIVLVASIVLGVMILWMIAKGI